MVNADPDGITFRDANLKEWRLCLEGGWRGWLLYRHPDGQWVSSRKWKQSDIEKLENCLTEAEQFELFMNMVK